MKNMKRELIVLLEMMAKNSLVGSEEIKIKHDSYMKGKGDAYLEVVNMLKQQEHEESKYTELYDMLKVLTS
jgi:hypothetical protein